MNDEPTATTPEDTTPSQPTTTDATATVDTPMPMAAKTKRQRRLHASGQTRVSFGVSTTFITIFGGRDGDLMIRAAMSYPDPR